MNSSRVKFRGEAPRFVHRLTPCYRERNVQDFIYVQIEVITLLEDIAL